MQLTDAIAKVRQNSTGTTKHSEDAVIPIGLYEWVHD
jgi:hypothetical protein